MAEKKFEDKPGDGVLMTNERKEPGTKQPDRWGFILAHRDIKKGERVRLAGWLKETKAGGKLLSLSMSDEREQQSKRDDDF